jgi:hypothetical protein
MNTEPTGDLGIRQIFALQAPHFGRDVPPTR